MVREDILEGLKSAVERGESLMQAMISFYNAGYKREDIQEAAQAMQEQTLTAGVLPNQINNSQIIPAVNQPIAQTNIQNNQQATPQIIPQVQGATPQVASQYGKKKKSGTGLIITLSIFLALLIGIVVVLIVFKDQLTNLFNKLG